ncbi:MAG: carboxypeptidase regulatory-like domain-containing protein [Deltaproteobacteria bacterium]|nr:carboxypeptidase regulatory-like domain-containing protein [Deltaproteobacteria bacterium]
MVADHPFYTLTKETGDFVLENVPPGKYTLQVWQETLGTVTQEVTVSGDSTNVTVRMQKK